MRRSANSRTLKTLLDHYTAPGLSLIFEDGHTLDLTDATIHANANRLEHDLECLPMELRAAADFSPCRVCPKRSEAAMCHALPAILPFLDVLNSRYSYDKLTAVFVEVEGKDQQHILHVTHTSLQRAVQYIAIQSVLGFCEMGRIYLKYFSGVIPFASAEMIAERVYANVMLEKNGDLEAVNETLQTMISLLSETMNCQLKRVRLVSKSDVFVNAFVNLHLAFSLLQPAERQRVRETLAQRHEAAEPA